MLSYTNCLKYLILTFIWICLTSNSIALPKKLKQTIQVFDKQDFETAKTNIDQLTQDPRFQHLPSTWYYRGVIYDQLMRTNITSDLASLYLEEALSAYQKTLSLAKRNSQYHSFANINIQGLWAYYINRGVQYYKLEAFEDALEQLSISQKTQADTPQTLLYTAIAAHQAENYATALEYYEKYIKINSAPPAVYRALADITYNYLKQTDEVYKILYNAIQQYPWDINLLEEYYQLLIKTNQLTNIQHRLQTELNETPNNTRIYYQLAYLYAQENKYEQAVAHYKKVLDLVPGHLETILQLGKLYYNQAARLSQHINNMPEEDFQQDGKEIIKKMNGYLETSLDYLQQANKLFPNNLDIMKLMHTLYTRLDRNDKIEQLVNKIKRVKGGMQLLESTNY